MLGLGLGLQYGNRKRKRKSVFLSDFVGKVAGSLVVNANVIKAGSSTSILTPIGFTGELAQVSYDNIMYLDGVTTPLSTIVNLDIPQQLFTFDLIRGIEDKISGTIPGVTVADKVTWLKANILSTKCVWYGFGTSPLGPKANMSMGVGTGGWGSVLSHIVGSVTPITYSPGTPSAYINASGFVNVNAYTNPSDGVTASTINTDYVSLEVILKAGISLA